MSARRRSRGISRELRSRLLVVAVIAPVSIVAIYLGGWYFTALVAVVAALTALEFYGLVRDRAGRPIAWLGVPAAVLLVAIAAHEPSFHVWGNRALSLLLLLGLLAVAISIFDRSTNQPLLSATATVSGVLYTGGTLSFALLLRSLPEIRGAMPVRPIEGFMLVMLPVAVTSLADTASYFVGKRLGRRRLAPRLSPGKTVEGSIGGLAGAVVTGYAAGLFLDGVGTLVLSAPVCAGIGLLLGIAGQLGDLSESLLKREAGVKDSGRLLPGHGGFLDRFDSLLFTIPLAYGLVLLAQVLA
ncbi:MAG: phosphatidate cytidylyltransferase [Gemmatimonadetes bacterium]|nr:phosphatidate cytidylyltransferase [Gemmatimonadota bacterium]MYD12787.1 phosphatidate cytidylyltransferase [Gemmatimonadota bacterium]MYI64480.1 phosphatidate cytidylyltransferase [Gemmatimonadota bacterium]